MLILCIYDFNKILEIEKENIIPIINNLFS